MHAVPKRRCADRYALHCGRCCKRGRTSRCCAAKSISLGTHLGLVQHSDRLPLAPRQVLRRVAYRYGIQL